MTDPTLTASASVVLLGLVYFRTGRGPLELLALWLLYARAVGLLVRMMAVAAWGRLDRFDECVETVRRNR